MSNKVYTIKLAEAHLNKVLALMDQGALGEFKMIWLSIQQQVAMQKQAVEIPTTPSEPAP
jgi:hypothetical protein